MATTTKAKTESLPERLTRQEAEEQALIGPQQDAANAMLADNEQQLAEASKADDTDKVLALGKEREALLARLDAVRKLILAKQAAIAETKRQLEAHRRGELVKAAHAHAKTAQDIATVVEQSMFDLTHALKDYAAQLHAARVSIISLGDGHPASCPMPTAHPLIAWVVNQLVNAGLPIRRAEAPDGWGNSQAVVGPGIAPVELAETAVSISETVR